jgi:hypothetical protein
MSHETLSLLVRWLHVTSMAVAFGGALLLTFVAVRPGDAGLSDPGHWLLGLAHHYERLFWLALGVLVMTGIGNLGAFGAALPAPSSAWGGRLGIKLAAVLALFILSVLRTFLVIRVSASGENGAFRAARLVPGLYGGTALGLALVALLAIALAHG